MKPKEDRDYIKLSECEAYFSKESDIISLVDWETIQLSLDDLKNLVKFVEKRQNELP